MRLIDLVETSRQVADTRSRLEKVARLAAFVRRLRENRALVPVGISYLAGDLPQGRLGVGWAFLRSLNATPPATEPTLELAEVDRVLTALKAEAGAGSGRRRNELGASLFARATRPEQELLVRLIGGELRQGALESVVADAVAAAFEAPPAAVRKAVMLAGGLPPVAAALAEAGVAGLDGFQLTLFQPVQPMLADTAADVEAALERLPEAAFEYKMDGARVQVHKDGDRVEVYSRQQNLVTPAVPEIVERVAALPARRLVLDGEAIAVALDRNPQRVPIPPAMGSGEQSSPAPHATANKRPLPFQETMRRFGRRLDVARLRQQMPLEVYFFDVLRLDDDTLIDRPLVERWQALEGATAAGDRVPRLVTASPEEADAFATRALQDGHEGVMAKGLQAVYSAGRRGQEWLKIKPAHTLDLVVLAAEWGSGRRQGWLSNLHLGARDPEQGGFVMLGKTFKGMTDEVLRWQTEALLTRELGRDAFTVHVRPELVVEIAFNDVQVSPQYPGGVALRFARLKRYRQDKRAEEADTIHQVRALLPKRA